jgi:hypothetical protein
MSVFENSTTSTGEPWSPLVPGTLQGVDFMRNLLSRGTYQGDYAAGIDPNQLAGISSGVTGAAGATGVGDAYRSAGNSVLPGIGQAFDYYGNAASGNSMNPWLTNGQQYMDLAGRFANNPYMDASIDAALQDPYRMLTEGQMPANNDSAIFTGGFGGASNAIDNAISKRGFADRASSIGANMRMAGLNTGYGIADDAAKADMMLSQHAADSLMQMGSKGLDWLSSGYAADQQGATDQFNWGTQNQNLQNDQIKAAMAKFNAPWEQGQSFGSYMNPLAGSLKQETVDESLLPAYLLQGLGPILGDIGSDVGGAAWDWIKNWDIWDVFKGQG